MIVKGPPLIDDAAQGGYSHNPPELMAEKLLARKVRDEGDRNAFETLFRTYYKRLHGFAYTYVRQVETAEDIVQSVFLKIWAERECWSPRGTVQSYLFSAVRNEALNILRHKQVIADTENEVIQMFCELKNQKQPYEQADLSVFQNQVQKGIELLPSRCRQIYLLNRRSGLTYTEIAEYLGISINTVNTQMGRALQFLRDHLSKYLPSFITAGISRLLF
jgi:RNA polymerase sigma-70 factor, ECF subfamily